MPMPMGGPDEGLMGPMPIPMGGPDEGLMGPMPIPMGGPDDGLMGPMPMHGARGHVPAPERTGRDGPAVLIAPPGDGGPAGDGPPLRPAGGPIRILRPGPAKGRPGSAGPGGPDDGLMDALQEMFGIQQSMHPLSQPIPEPPALRRRLQQQLLQPQLMQGQVPPGQYLPLYSRGMQNRAAPLCADTCILTLSADGSKVALLLVDDALNPQTQCTIDVWEVQSGSHTYTWGCGNIPWAHPIALSADASVVASAGRPQCGDRVLDLWDVQSGVPKLIKTLTSGGWRKENPSVQAVAFSADGRNVAVLYQGRKAPPSPPPLHSRGYKIMILEVSTGNCIWMKQKDDGEAGYAIALSADGRFAAVKCKERGVQRIPRHEETIDIYEVPSDKLIKTLKLPISQALSATNEIQQQNSAADALAIALSADATVVTVLPYTIASASPRASASASHASIGLWEVQSGAPAAKDQGPLWRSLDPRTGQWVPYDPHTTRRLEDAFRQDPHGTAPIVINGTDFRVHFSEMMQYNNQSGRRRVQRLGRPSSDEQPQPASAEAKARAEAKAKAYSDEFSADREELKPYFMDAKDAIQSTSLAPDAVLAKLDAALAKCSKTKRISAASIPDDNGTGKTLLHYAAARPDSPSTPVSEIIAKVLDAGAKPTAADVDRRTALHDAAHHGNADAAQALVRVLSNESRGVGTGTGTGTSIGADGAGGRGPRRGSGGASASSNPIDTPSGSAGRTPLHEAALGRTPGHVRVLHILCDAGARAEAGDVDGKTPLLIAVENLCIDTALALLDRGANEKAVRRRDGKNVLDILKERSATGKSESDKKRQDLQRKALAVISKRKREAQIAVAAATWVEGVVVRSLLLQTDPKSANVSLTFVPPPSATAAGAGVGAAAAIQKVRTGKYDVVEDTYFESTAAQAENDNNVSLDYSLYQALAYAASVPDAVCDCVDVQNALHEYEESLESTLACAQSVQGSAQVQVSPLYFLAHARLSELASPGSPTAAFLFGHFRQTFPQLAVSIAEGGWCTDAEVAAWSAAGQPQGGSAADGLDDNAGSANADANAGPKPGSLEAHWADTAKHLTKAQQAPMDKLMKLTGLQQAKQIALKIYRGVLADAKLRSNGCTSGIGERVLNFAFLGNPGTGKSTVGRLFAELLECAGARAGHKYIEMTAAEALRKGAKAFATELASLGGWSRGRGCLANRISRVKPPPEPKSRPF